MMPPDLEGAVIVGAVLAFVAGVAGFVWYAIALSRLFPKVGGESWKGWVPLVNEAEILTRGGIPGWSVVYYFIPVLQLYGVYLKAVAMLRINRKLGRGAGLMIVGFLFPPVWASVLSWGRVPDGAELRVDAAPSARVRPDPVKSPRRTKPEPTLGVRVTDASGYAIPQNAPSSPSQTPAAQLLVAEVPIAPAAPVVAEVPPASPVPPMVAGLPVAPPTEPAPHAQWNLRLDDGRAFSLTAARVEVGRKPSSEDATAQLLAIDDSTRTLSKTHARLTFDDGRWTITDLKSTNGVMVVAVGGEEALLGPGASANVVDRFVLGDVGMRLSFD